jgi:hypothetical protein
MMVVQGAMTIRSLKSAQGNGLAVEEVKHSPP